MLIFSSLYHHQANSLAEQTARTCKGYSPKPKRPRSAHIKRCMYIPLYITPIDDPHHRFAGVKARNKHRKTEVICEGFGPHDYCNKTIQKVLAHAITVKNNNR